MFLNCLSSIKPLEIIIHWFHWSISLYLQAGGLNQSDDDDANIEYDHDDIYVVGTTEEDAAAFIHEQEDAKYREYTPNVTKKFKWNESLDGYSPPSIDKKPIIIQQHVPTKCERWCCQNLDQPPVYEDCFTVFGKFVADELRNTNNQRSRHKAKLAINQVMYKACVGEFDMESTEENGTFQIQYSIPALASSTIDDQFTSFGRYVASELKLLHNHAARQIAKAKICQIICEASLDSSQQTFSIWIRTIIYFFKKWNEVFFSYIIYSTKKK